MCKIDIIKLLISIYYYNEITNNNITVYTPN